jgi:site-specific DNA-methyltransferase (adenine-specific)
VRHFSNPGDLVLIPFVGSGSECVAAAENGRNFIGAEINHSYVEIARNRLEAISLPLEISLENPDN